MLFLGFYAIRLRAFYARLNSRKYYPALYTFLHLTVVPRLCFCLVCALFGHAWASASPFLCVVLLVLASIFQMRMAEIARNLRAEGFRNE